MCGDLSKQPSETSSFPSAWRLSPRHCEWEDSGQQPTTEQMRVISYPSNEELSRILWSLGNKNPLSVIAIWAKCLILWVCNKNEGSVTFGNDGGGRGGAGRMSIS